MNLYHDYWQSLMIKFIALITGGMTLLVSFTQTASAQWVYAGLADPHNEYGGIRAVALNGGKLFAGTGNGPIFQSANNGLTWSTADSGLSSGGIWSLRVSEGMIYAGTMNGLFTSINNGISWTQISPNLLTGPVYSLAFSDSNIFLAVPGGIYISTNNGRNWVAGCNTGTFTYSVAVSNSNIIAGTDVGLFLSTNNGNSCNMADTSLKSYWVVALAVAGNTIFAGTYDGIFISTNNGTKWTAADSGFITSSDTFPPCVYAFAVSGGNIFAGTEESGVYVSTNNGASWTAANSGFIENNATRWIYSLAVSGDTLYAGTMGAGVWFTPISQIVGVHNFHIKQEQSFEPTFNVLSTSTSNYNATIQFSLSHPDKVSLTVYNFSGHQIGSLINQKLSQGTHSISWNTKNLTPGCYAVKLQEGSNTFVKSVPIIR
jgi:hypothetical protein